MKAKYKVGDEVQFIFAGCPEIGTIIEVDKTNTKVLYTIEDSQYKYPTEQTQIKEKVKK